MWFTTREMLVVVVLVMACCLHTAEGFTLKHVSVVMDQPSEDGRAVKQTFIHHVNDSLVEHPTLDNNNREVNIGKPSSDVVVQGETTNFINSGRVLREESSAYKNVRNGISFSEALSQEVSKSDIAYSIPKMVVIVATTVASLFGMCVLAAVFQCCCRKKRTGSDSDPVESVKEEGEVKQRSKSPSPEKDVNKASETEEKTENDHLLEDEDLGDFSAVQRQTEILKSYRKPPPPKNRARASRAPRPRQAGQPTDDAFSLIKEEYEGSKSSSLRSSPEKMKEESPSKGENRLSFEAAKQMVDSMLAEVKEKRERTPVVVESGDCDDETSHFNGGGNIFMQIDPTVRIQDPGTTKSPARSIPSSPVTSSSSGNGEGANLRPTSANREQRKFLIPSVHGEHMDQLVKSLKTRLKEDKSQSARNLASNKVRRSQVEPDVEPSSRERSYSDPMKKLLAIKPTYV